MPLFFINKTMVKFNLVSNQLYYVKYLERNNICISYFACELVQSQINLIDVNIIALKGI